MNDKKLNYDEMLEIVYNLVKENCPSIEKFLKECNKDCEKCRKEKENGI